MKEVVDAIVINEQKEILLVNRKGKRILPWGKKEEGETDYQTLQRELKEEINWTLGKEHENSFYKEFLWETPFSQQQVMVKAYFSKLLEENLIPNNEIQEVCFTKDFHNISLSEITEAIISALQEDWFLATGEKE